VRQPDGGGCGEGPSAACAGFLLRVLGALGTEVGDPAPRRSRRFGARSLLQNTYSAAPLVIVVWPLGSVWYCQPRSSPVERLRAFDIVAHEFARAERAQAAHDFRTGMCAWLPEREDAAGRIPHGGDSTCV